MAPIHISLDTETWGKRAGCDARSIGACLFDPKTGAIGDDHPVTQKLGVAGTFYRALDNPLLGFYPPNRYTPEELDLLDGPTRKYNLHRDPQTVAWWYSQPEEARNAFNDRVDLHQGLTQFVNWFGELGISAKNEHDVRIWSHGRAYDPPIVEAWFHVTRLIVPYHYRAPRDTRTAFDFVDIQNHSNFLKAFREGVAHHALDDAVTQARAICAAYDLRGDPTPVRQ